MDAFANKPFGGNPAAVCLLEEPLDEAVMQAIAAEMNLSETAFILPQAHHRSSRFSLRWFTPQVEVNLCGHATLASAFVLFEEMGVPTDTVFFETLSGTLTAERVEQGFKLDFPADPSEAFSVPRAILGALGTPDVEGAYRGKTTRMLLLHLKDADALRTLQPDFPALGRAADKADCMGVIVTDKEHHPMTLSRDSLRHRWASTKIR